MNVISSSKIARPGRLDGVRVLVVDDDEDARDLVAWLLGSRGAEVSLASSAEEGRGQFAAVRPDVVVSDIGMPLEDGYSFVASLRALPPEGGGLVPSIALTAFTSRKDRDRALAAGFNAHLTKPIDAQELLAAIAALLTLPAGQQSA